MSYTLLSQSGPAREVLDHEGHSNTDIVQFGLPVLVVRADSPYAVVPVMRIGDHKGSCSFSYTTIEASAKAGSQFYAEEGRIRMGPGKGEEFIKIKLIDDPHWNATLEFRVQLSDPEDCQLGLYLKVIRVKVIDATTFPTNDFKEDIAKVLSGEQEIAAINEFALFRGCLRWMSSQHGVWWRTLMTIFFDVCKNAYHYMTLVLHVYMIDTVFNFNTHSGLLIPGNRLGTAYAVACLILLPIIVFWIFDTIVIKMDIKGNLRGSLGRGLFRKFMNYTRESWDSVPLPDKVAAITLDTNDVTDSYLRVLSMIRLLGKIVVSISFTLQHNPDVWWAVAAVPTIMAIWGLCRRKKFADASNAASDCECARTEFVNEIFNKLRLVAHYAQRPQINYIFAEKTDSLTAVKIPEAQVILNNMFLARLMGPVLVASYTVIGANLVLNKELKLGVYLATIGVFGNICDSFAELFGLAMAIIQKSFTLSCIADILNKPTELANVMEAITFRQHHTEEKRATMPQSTVPRVDRLEIELVNVSFKYAAAPEALFEDMNLHCAQGAVVAIMGGPGSGRRTLVELLCGGLYPDSGYIFIPSHLRVLHVSREVMLLNLSVWQNVVFGNHLGNNPYRVEKILDSFSCVNAKKMCEKDLRKHKREFDRLGHIDAEAEEKEEEEEYDNVQADALSMASLSDTEKSLLHLTRGFVMNPEVMVLHRPFMHYHNDHATVDCIKTAFKEQVSNRGWHMPLESKLSRRPRTLFYTCDDAVPDQAITDLSWNLDDGTDHVYATSSHHHSISQSNVPHSQGASRASTYNEPHTREASRISNDANLAVGGRQSWEPNQMQGASNGHWVIRQAWEPTQMQGPSNGAWEFITGGFHREYFQTPRTCMPKRTPKAPVQMFKRVITQTAATRWEI